MTRKYKPKPNTVRKARRSLRYERDHAGRVLVGAYWLECRIIGDTVEQVTEVALNQWRDA